MQSLLAQAVKGMLPNNLLRNNFLRRQEGEGRAGFEDPKSSAIQTHPGFTATLVQFTRAALVGFDQKHSRTFKN